MTDGNAAVGSFYLDRWPALADLCVDVIADRTLGCDGEGDGDASVDRGCNEVGGIVVGSLHGDAAIGGFGEQSFSVPLRAVEGDIETAVDGSGVNFAAKIAEGEAAVGGVGGNLSVDVRYFDAAVFRMQLGGEVAWDVQAEVDIPTVAEQSEKRARRGTFSANGAVGENLDFLEQGLGSLGARLLSDDAGLEGNVRAIFPDDFDAAVFAGDDDLAVDQGQSSATKLAGLFFAAEEAGVVGVAFVSVARSSGEGLGVQGDGEECQGEAENEFGSEFVHGCLLRTGAGRAAQMGTAGGGDLFPGIA